MPAVSVNGHVGDAGLVMRRRVEVLHSDQMRMPYVRARVVDAGGVVVTLEGERVGLESWNRRVASNVDVLRMVALKEDKALFY